MENELVEKLVEVNVLVADDGREQFSLSDEFVDAVDGMGTSEAIAALEASRFADRFPAANPGERLTAPDVPSDVPRTLAAVVDAADGLSFEQYVKALLLVDQIRHPEPSAGVPNHFVPVRGSLLELLTDLYPTAVVYVWMTDCDPCEVMVEELATVFDEEPESVALFSVYGPDHADVLESAYDVVGGPTLLFVENGAVAARLQGAHYADVVAAEVAKLTD